MVRIARIPGCQEERSLEISSFRQNSTEVEKGDLFFALKGNKVDGACFLQQVAAKGAVAAVVSKEYQGDSFGLFLFHAENVLASLQGLAREWLKKNEKRIIGLTGSVGKTTTKEFLATLLERKYRVGKSPGSMNSQISLPLNVLNRKGEVLVLEMGMCMPGEIANLVSIAPPDLAIITKIAPAHIANFEEGLLGIAKAKCEIFSHPKTKKVVAHAGLLDFVRPEKEFVTFSLQDRTADFFLVSEGERVCIWEKGKKAAHFSLLIEEIHFKEDFLAAAAAARWMGLSWLEIEERAAFLQTPKMRFEKMCVGGVVYINDAYNANPDSVGAALDALPKPKEGGRVIAVLGEMADQGVFSEINHQEIGKKAESTADILFCYGKETAPMAESFREKGKRAEIFLDKKELFHQLKKLVQVNDVVLVKGKRSQELDQLFTWMTQTDCN